MKYSFLKKRGSIDVQFNWIFVLIIGALILLFFINVMKTSEKTSTASTYQSLSFDMKNIISQTESDVGNSRTILLPKITLNFECESFDIEKSRTSEDIRYKTIFSPNQIKGREILTYTEKFEMPYPADYFLYLTSNQVRYVFVNDTNCRNDFRCQVMIKEITKRLPLNATYEIVPDSRQVRENNFYKERFVFFSIIPDEALHDSLDDLDDDDVTALLIDSRDLGYGSISFYEKSGNGFVKKIDSSYLGIELLTGAVLSDYELYECNMKDKAIFKFKTLTQIYLNRTEEFKKEYRPYSEQLTSPERICYQAYSLINISKTINALNNPSLSNFGIVWENSKRLEDINEDSLLNSCPSIY